MSDLNETLRSISISGNDLESQDNETGSEEEDLSNEDPGALDQTRIATSLLHDLLDLLRQSTGLQEGDDKLPPREEYDVNLCIRQLLSCGNVTIITQCVKLLADTARDRE